MSCESCNKCGSCKESFSKERCYKYREEKDENVVIKNIKDRVHYLEEIVMGRAA